MTKISNSFKMITVREATRQDIPVLMDFQTKMAAETENVTLDLAILQAGMDALFNDPGKGKYFVAADGQDILGCLMTTFEWSEWRNGNVLWIQSVYVHGSARGRGVYKQMYEHIRAIVDGNGNLRGIRLYADKTNHKAQRVYEKLGMNGEHYQVYEWMKN